MRLGAALLAAFALSFPAPAADPFAEGQRIASGGGPGGPTAACFACHGVDGNGQAASGFPRLAGLGQLYLHKQLNDYAGGERPNEIMTPIARALSQEQRQAVSAYYSALAWRAPQPVVSPRGDAALVQHGGVIYALGSADRRLQACANCHGPGAEGIPPTYPALAGQPASYVAEQLRRFRSGQRANSIAGTMSVIAGRMSDRDIEAAAAYLAAFPVRGTLIAPPRLTYGPVPGVVPAGRP